jgi:hypothetical protein
MHGGPVQRKHEPTALQLDGQDCDGRGRSSAKPICLGGVGGPGERCRSSGTLNRFDRAFMDPMMRYPSGSCMTVSVSTAAPFASGQPVVLREVIPDTVRSRRGRHRGHGRVFVEVGCRPAKAGYLSVPAHSRVRPASSKDRANPSLMPLCQGCG